MLDGPNGATVITVVVVSVRRRTVEVQVIGVRRIVIRRTPIVTVRTAVVETTTVAVTRRREPKPCCSYHLLR